MTLEFEKLTGHLETMAQSAARRRKRQEAQAAQYHDALHSFATDWVRIGEALETAVSKSDEKFYRSARPFDENEPLDIAVDAPPPPDIATIIATDGSQILPDRHAPYVYYLVNVGGIVYHHGQPIQPDVFSIPEITYPDDDRIDEAEYSSGRVSIERDLAEISMLADKSWAHRHSAQPIVSIVDQRLLYWPIGNAGVAENFAVTQWGESMTKARDAGALLAGYIDRPGTAYVTTLLRSLIGLDDETFDWRSLGRRSATGGVTDRDLFRTLLKPGQRSKIFTNISEPNTQFATLEPLNEVCFFYLNPTTSDQRIARVDIPRWVAEDAGAVTAVHSLIIDQCRLLGDYPYVISRADEMAVVGKRDAAELNFMLDVIMDRHGVGATSTAKADSKGLARSGKSRHEGF